MKRSRFSEEQIVGVLKEAEAGVPLKDLCRRVGVSEATGATGHSKKQIPHPRSRDISCAR